MSLYPDNVPRANRVRHLATDIAHIQSQLKEEVEDARKNDEAALELLGEIARNAGYKTLDEYVEAAAQELSAEDRAAFDKMKTDLEDLDEALNLSHKVFRGLIAVGIITSGVRIFAIQFKETQSILFGVQAVLKSIYYAAAGAVESAVKLATWGRVTLNLVSKGGGIANDALESMKFLKMGGNLLVAIGVFVDAALLIAEAIQGAQQRADLRAAIVELCSRRFIVKENQQHARAILNFTSDSRSIIKMKTVYDGLVEKGRMTGDEVAEDLKPEMEKVETNIKAAINKITSQTIWNLLDSQDNESHIAWKNEDPSLSSILQWIEDRSTEEEK